MADGISWDAIFCMRDILRELPQIMLSGKKKLSQDEFLDIIKSNYATKKDLMKNSYRNKRIGQFQEYYVNLLELVSHGLDASMDKLLLEITMRSSVINKADRVTGDSITTIVDKIINHRPKMDSIEIYTLLREFIEYQNLNPRKDAQKDDQEDDQEEKKSERPILKNMLKIVRHYREGL